MMAMDKINGGIDQRRTLRNGQLLYWKFTESDDPDERRGNYNWPSRRVTILDDGKTINQKTH